MNAYRVAAILSLMLLLTACGPKPKRSESVLDNPAYHVSQGLKLLERGDLEGAGLEFDRARDLDPTYPQVYAGRALLLAQRGEFEEAGELSDEAVSKAKRDPFVWAARARVFSLAEKPGEVDKGSDKDFEKATDLDPGYDLAWYWWGLAKRRSWLFAEAGEKFTQAIALRGDRSAEANSAYREVQDIVRAAPGSRIGMNIAQADTLTRADLAALFMEELKLAEVLERSAGAEPASGYLPPKDPTELPEAGGDRGATPEDVRGHWAETWIMQAIGCGVLEVSPDRKFYPDQPVTRGEVALLLQNILASVLRQPELTTRYVGEKSRFMDMRSGTATYNAAALAVDRGFMEAAITGQFHPEGIVSGAEALLDIRKFQDQLEFHF